MQEIWPTTYSPEHYVQIEGQRQVRPKEHCACCGAATPRHRHGDYERNVVSRAGATMRITVARFRCAECGGTTSCLPSFALTYRLLGPSSFEAYLGSEYGGLDVQRHWDLLRRYERRMTDFAATLVGLVGMGLGLAPPRSSVRQASSLCEWMKMACGDLEIATGRLVEGFRVGLLHHYRCHRGR